MERKIMDELLKWKLRKNRKPLILRGARQVGKTYILNEFGKENYETIAYFNFDNDENLYNIFEYTKDPKRIIENLLLYCGKKISEEKTLIFFDEIQECPNALNSLKYFCENASSYHIVCAGSLLGIKLSKSGFPVGKVDFLDMTPMTFTEFLKADNCGNLLEYLSSINKIEAIPDLFFVPLEEKLKAYFIIGGMPEVVDSWVLNKDIEEVNRLQDSIIRSYENDFSKHTTNSESNKISLVWNSIPSQLAKNNKKFLYQVIKEGARAREYEDAINWLKDADIVLKINNVTKPELPLSAYHDLTSFKIYLNDVGLLRSKTNIDSKIAIAKDDIYGEYKGSLTENYILNMLKNIYGNCISYYTFDNFEIDYVLQTKNEIIPIEVKSGKNINNISLTKYNEKYNPKLRIRLSMKNLSLDGNLLNVPLFMIEYLPKLIDLALETIKSNN